MKGREKFIDYLNYQFTIILINSKKTYSNLESKKEMLKISASQNLKSTSLLDVT